MVRIWNASMGRKICVSHDVSMEYGVSKLRRVTVAMAETQLQTFCISLPSCL